MLYILTVNISGSQSSFHIPPLQIQTLSIPHQRKSQNDNTVHPRFSGPRLTGPSINRPGSTGRKIQLFSLKSTRFTVEKN